MDRTIRTLLALAVLFVVSASVCERVPERQWDRGDFRPIPPNTKPYQLPAGLEVVGIAGATDPTPGSDLPLELTVRSTRSGRASVTFPAGLIFGPDVVDYQYMLLLQDFSFSVPPGDDTLLSLPAYCANEDLDTPDETSPYSLQPREWDRETEELLDLVAGKRLEGDTAVTLAQDALFEITDGEGLADSTRTKLKSLP
jgi:hypothetical protein